jgi:hypothetical protein
MLKEAGNFSEDVSFRASRRLVRPILSNKVSVVELNLTRQGTPSWRREPAG